MAIDRIRIFIPEITKAIIIKELSWTNKRYRGPWKSHSVENLSARYHRRVSFYKFGTMSIKSGIFDVEFMKRSENHGDLSISCSVSELYFQHNFIPKSCVGTTDFIELTLEQLSAVLDTDQLPHYSKWTLSYFEANVDVIDIQSCNENRLKLSSMIDMPYRKADCQYADRGSVYQRGRAGKRSKSQFALYDKVKEQLDRKGIDLRERLCLTQGQGCLRLESKLGGDPLKDIISKCREEIEDGALLSPLDIIFHQDFQLKILWKAIKDLYLDKIVTTRKKLLKIIRTSTLLTKHEKKQAQYVVNHLNGERHSLNMHKDTLRKYIKIILSLGYSPFTSESEIQPITFQKLQDALSSDLRYINFIWS